MPPSRVPSRNCGLRDCSGLVPAIAGQHTRSYHTATTTAVLLLTLTALVHASAATSAFAQRAKSAPPAAQNGAQMPAFKAPEVRYGSAGLPGPVLEMRDAIQAAVASGQIEELKIPLEMNEMKPNFGDGPVADPIGHLKQASKDGEGREVLEALGKLLEAGYAVLPLGRDIENNRIYVWPYFAETGVRDLTPAQEAELLALVPEPEIKAMRDNGGRYTHWRVGIAADGTWHVLAR